MGCATTGCSASSGRKRIRSRASTPSTISVAITDCRAFNWYRRPDNRIVGLWKDNYMVVSTGSTWDPGQVPSPSVSSSFRWHTGAKIWGQQTEDGRYAMVGCANNSDP